MSGDHHGCTAEAATLLSTAVDEVLGAHRYRTLAGYLSSDGIS
jgi:hypothetical protein